MDRDIKVCGRLEIGMDEGNVYIVIIASLKESGGMIVLMDLECTSGQMGGDFKGNSTRLKGFCTWSRKECLSAMDLNLYPRLVFSKA
jgi:hypothetical protein